MRIYLFLNDRIVDFSLPKEVAGSFSFDFNNDEEAKLINVEAKNGEWVIYSTVDVSVISGENNILCRQNLVNNNFYVLRRRDINFLIYVSDLSLNKIYLYSYDKNMNLSVGNSSNVTLLYPCPYLGDKNIRFIVNNNKIFLECDSLQGVYINKKAVTSSSSVVNIGDEISIYALRLIFLSEIVVINNPTNNLPILLTSNLIKYDPPSDNGVPSDLVIRDKELYNKRDFFSKSPMIRTTINQFKLKLSPPPMGNDNDDLPTILTVGPMITMGMTSGATMLEVYVRLKNKEVTLSDSWSSLLISGTMLLSMLFWPLITEFYSKRMQKKKRKKLVIKYSKYLDTKRNELTEELNNQKRILIENLVTVDNCLNIIQNKNMNFWNKRIDQNDFLNVRVGMGNDFFKVNIEYPEEGFTMDEDELKDQADKLVSQFKYIDNVPIGYSLYENKLTAVMCNNKVKGISFVNNILLQLFTFYSYDDLKVVIFTSKYDENNWDYIKYLNHNFSNDKKIRFFSSNNSSADVLADFLYNCISSRKNRKNNNIDNESKVYKPYYLIVVDDYDIIRDYEFVNILTENDNNFGVSMLILEEKLSKLPSKCNNYITIQDGGSSILKNRYDKQEQITFIDEINYNVDYMSVARTISNIPIEFEEKVGALPDSISFMEMDHVGKVEQLNILNRWNTNDATSSLRAEVGLNNQKKIIYLDLHEKYHGPHGLIAGTTGSGKSEFIITYILSMCVNYSPDDVAFILIDYKGGGLALAFENKITGVSLPHLAGTITNLDKSEMNRTLVSIDSEVKRRQRMFNEARDILGESTMDIYKYQTNYKLGKLKEPIPHLFIICDEFAELKSQQPDFMDNLISVARIGRSLGVHLILATQKPSGVVNDQIWSNTRFRVCLKVQDEADSNEMLKRPEAAHITQSGRFYLQIGYDEIFVLGQSGYSGAKYYPSDKILKKIDKNIDFIDDCGNFVKSIKQDDNVKLVAQGEQIAAVMKNIILVANSVNKKARRLWLDNVPSIILVDDIYKKYNIKSTEYNVEAIIGEYDAPEMQEQGIVKYNYLTDGNIIIYSQIGSDSEMLLDALIYSSSKYHLASEINFYIIDYGSESLRKFMNLPHVGGMVFSGEEDKYKNLIKLVRRQLVYRKKLFVNYGSDYKNYIKNSSEKLPICTIIINNFDAFYETHDWVYDEFPELIRDSFRYGIIFIFTSSSSTSIPIRISQNFNNSYALKLKESGDYYDIFNTNSIGIIPSNVSGRGLLNNGGIHEFQVASIVPNSNQLGDYLIKFADYENKITKFRAVPIPTLPRFVRYEHIKNSISSLKNVPIGITRENLEVSKFNLIENIGTIISAYKIEDTDVFVRSLLEVLRTIPGIDLIVLDPLKILGLNPKYYPNYFTDNFGYVLLKLTEVIQGLIDNKDKKEGIVVIYGLSKFPECVDTIELPEDNEDKSSSDSDEEDEEEYDEDSEDDEDEEKELSGSKNFLKFMQKIYTNGHFGVLGIDDSRKLKNVQYEDWYTHIFPSENGIWIGKGIDEQGILKTDDFNTEFKGTIPNDIGFKVEDGSMEIIKLLNFLGKGDED